MFRKLIAAICVAILAGGCLGLSQRAARKAGRRLREATATANRLRVCSGVFYYDSIEGEEGTLCELVGNDNVAGFVRHLKFSKLTPKCKCTGGLVFEFRQGRKLLAVVSYHHSTHMRCPDLWKGDAYLSDGSLSWLVNWLEDRGIAG